MKKLFTLILVLLVTTSTFAQSPNKISYQCVVRNASGVLVINQSIGIRISILQGTTTGSAVYQETFSPTPQTNANGLLSIEIGGGTVISGTFSSINWAAGPYFLKTETDPTGGSNYTIVGTSQLLSVPYALYSKTAGNGFSGIYNDLTDKPVLFDGTWTSLTGKPSTLAGFGITNAVNTTDNQTVGGIKTFTSDLLINGLTAGRGKGAISTNAAFGNQALNSNTTGNYNTATGTQALFTNTTGYNNTATGYAALYYNTTGYNNTATGYAALYTNSTGHENTAYGRDALGFNTTGQQNTATGYQALLNNTTGSSNTGDGYQAGYTNTTGSSNVMLGYQAGYYETGSNKLFIDNQHRASESDGRAKSLIYGVFDANPANQLLTINGNVSVSNNKISNVANPVSAQDAATKDYVDKLKLEIKALEDNLVRSGSYILTDADGNQYGVVRIGNQVWMSENLKTTKYNDGTAIPYATATGPSYFWYNNSEASYGNIFGALYNWHAVETDKLCPTGWHVPSYTEWTTLITYLGGSTVAGGKLKETGVAHWSSPNTGASNSSGFTALPGGRYNVHDVPASFINLATNGNWWSRTPNNPGLVRYFASAVTLSYDQSSSAAAGNAYMVNGFSVRCIQDIGPAITTNTVINNGIIPPNNEYSLQSGGSGIDDHGSAITHKGVCWNTSGNPDLTSSGSQHTDEGTGPGSFTSNIVAAGGHPYCYIRAYATNGDGTNYGRETAFSLPGK